MTTSLDNPLEPHDYGRIARQRRFVFTLMQDGRWRTLADISRTLGYPEASVSARLRDFRKERYGGHQVDRRRAYPGSGLWEYRLLTVPDPRFVPVIEEMELPNEAASLWSDIQHALRQK